MATDACVQTMAVWGSIIKYSVIHVLYFMCLIYHVIMKTDKQLYEDNLFLQFNHVNIYDNPHYVYIIHSIIDLLHFFFFFLESTSSRSSDEEQGESSYSTRYYLRKRQTDYCSSYDENQSKRRRKLSSKSSSCKGTYWLVQCLKTQIEHNKKKLCNFELENFFE